MCGKVSLRDDWRRGSWISTLDSSLHQSQGRRNLFTVFEWTLYLTICYCDMFV